MWLHTTRRPTYRVHEVRHEARHEGQDLPVPPAQARVPIRQARQAQGQGLRGQDPSPQDRAAQDRLEFDVYDMNA